MNTLRLRKSGLRKRKISFVIVAERRRIGLLSNLRVLVSPSYKNKAMVACKVRVLADDVTKLTKGGGILIIQDDVCLKDNRELVYSALFSRVKELDRLLERKGETMPRNDYKRLTDERDKTFVLLGRYSKN